MLNGEPIPRAPPPVVLEWGDGAQEHVQANQDDEGQGGDVVFEDEGLFEADGDDVAEADDLLAERDLEAEVESLFGEDLSLTVMLDAKCGASCRERNSVLTSLA